MKILLTFTFKVNFLLTSYRYLDSFSQASGLGDLGIANLAQELMDEEPKRSVHMAEETDSASVFRIF